MTGFIKTVEADAVIAWNDFLKGVQWVGAEVQAGIVELEKLDPAIQVELQAVVTAANVAAAAMAAKASGGATNIVANVGGEIETLVAELLQKFMGGTVPGQTLSVAILDALKQIEGVLVAAVPVAVANIAAKIGAAGHISA